MNNLKYIKPETLLLKNNPAYSEKWVQQRIAEDPSLLGLGDLVLKDTERVHPRAGRLDLLLQDPDSERRYEVELQLGATDEAHIIRTLEYWDIERKRYPQYDHTAVIVAEDITSRFLNVISLFNGHIPLVAIQMSALKVGESLSLVFTKVLDQVQLGLVDEDEVVAATDRTYWENRSSKEVVSIADDLLSIIKTIDPDQELKYNKLYIGLVKNDQANNFVVFKPRKGNLRLEARLAQSTEWDKKLEDAGLEALDYDKYWGRYRIRLVKSDVPKHRALLTELLQQAYANAT